MATADPSKRQINICAASWSVLPAPNHSHFPNLLKLIALKSKLRLKEISLCSSCPLPRSSSCEELPPSVPFEPSSCPLNNWIIRGSCSGTDSDYLLCPSFSATYHLADFNSHVESLNSSWKYFFSSDILLGAAPPWDLWPQSFSFCFQLVCSQLNPVSHISDPTAPRSTVIKWFPRHDSSPGGGVVEQSTLRAEQRFPPSSPNCPGDGSKDTVFGFYL